MDVFRLNASHGSHYDRVERVRRIRAAAANLDKFAALADLQDPKIRIHGFAGTDAVELSSGDPAFADWCRDNSIALNYIQPGKPNQNAYIERFNRMYRRMPTSSNP